MAFEVKDLSSDYKIGCKNKMQNIVNGNNKIYVF